MRGGLADSSARVHRRSRAGASELDRAAGLVPFAVKLNEEVVAKLHALAQGREGGLNAVVSELLKKGMESKAK